MKFIFSVMRLKPKQSAAKTACRRGKQIIIQFHHTGRGLYIRGGKLNALKITCDGRELSYTASAAGSELMIKLT